METHAPHSRSCKRGSRLRVVDLPIRTGTQAWASAGTKKSSFSLSPASTTRRPISVT
jgi:hypothetical protein